MGMIPEASESPTRRIRDGRPVERPELALSRLPSNGKPLPFVFDVGGNKVRLSAAVHINSGKVFVRHVLSHAEYDRGQWKRKEGIQ